MTSGSGPGPYRVIEHVPLIKNHPLLLGGICRTIELLPPPGAKPKINIFEYTAHRDPQRCYKNIPSPTTQSRLV